MHEGAVVAMGTPLFQLRRDAVLLLESRAETAACGRRQNPHPSPYVPAPDSWYVSSHVP